MILSPELSVLLNGANKEIFRRDKLGQLIIDKDLKIKVRRLELIIEC